MSTVNLSTAMLALGLDTSLPAYNILPTKLPKFRLAMGKVRQGTANARILCLGDSTTAGTGAGTGTAAYPNAYPKQLADNFVASGLSATGQSFIGSSRGNRLANDSRLSITGGFTQVQTDTALGGGYYTGTSAGTVVFTPSGSFDTFVIWFHDLAAGSFTINVDGGSTLATVTCTNTQSMRSQTVTTTLATHTLNIVWASGAVRIAGVECYDSSAKRVIVSNGGSGGASSVHFASTSNAYDAPVATVAYAPDLVILDIGINDYAGYGLTVAQFTTNLQTFMTYVKTNHAIEVILKTSIPSAITQRTLDIQQQWATAMLSVASQYDVPCIDSFTRWGSYETLNPLGYYSDTIHPNGPGYADVAAAVAKTLKTVL